MEKYRTIQLSQWKKTGAGANGVTYQNEDGTELLKIKKAYATETEIGKEFKRDKTISMMGIQTAAPLEMVKAGNKYGIIYENLRHKKSYSRLVADDPDNIEKYAKAFAQKTKLLHETPCDTESFEGRAFMIRKGVENAKFIGKYKPGLYKIIDQLSDRTTCLHGDLQTGNLVHSEGKDYWIDFDRFSYGDPILDFAHMYTVYISMSWFIYIQHLFHMNKRTLNKFWYLFMEEYYGFNKEETGRFNKKLMLYNALDIVQRNYFRPNLFADLVTLILVRPKIKRYFKEQGM